MKRYILFILLLVFAAGIEAQTDRSKAPVAGDPVDLQLGNYKTFKLKNGLTVILVENHKLPVVSFSLALDFDPILEGDQAGAISMAGSLLRSGTASRTKQDIDASIDFIGASLSTSSRGVFASSLKKHQDLLLELMSDVALNPSFPEAEFEKVKKQTLSGLQMSSTDAGSISANVTQVLRYGKDHPYGEIATEESVNNISLDNIRQYHATYFRPNVAYLIMVGDLSLKESKALAKKWFGGWEKAEVPRFTYPAPPSVDGVRVVFVDKPGAVQSVISITHPVFLKPGEPDVIPTMLMNNILGGGVFSGRLMLNLREDKAYTYGATSSLSTDRLVGAFQAGAQVGNAVTDSAITEFFYEIRRMTTDPVSSEDLQMNKNIVFGQFARALESPQTVANFALNTIRYKLPENYYADYLKKLDGITEANIMEMAAKYLKPDDCLVIVVGNKGEVAEKLAGFATSGKVEYFDRHGNPEEKAEASLAADVTPAQLVERFIEASGGRQALEAVKQMTMMATGYVSAMGQEVELAITRYQESPNKICMKMEMQGMTLSTQVYDGNIAFIKSMQGNSDLTGKDLEEMKYDSYMFPELFYLDEGYQLELCGVEKVNGKDCACVKVTNPAGGSQNEYYSLDTGLKLRVIIHRTTPQGPMQTMVDYADFREVSGVLMPFDMQQQVGPQMIHIKVDSIDTSTPVDQSVYKK